MVDNVPQELLLLQLELTFGELGLQPLPYEGLQHLSKVLLMLRLSLEVDQDIIYEYYHRPLQHRPANPVHEIHQHFWSIGEPKWHHHKLVMTITSSEGCLMYIIIPDPHLMVP